MGGGGISTPAGVLMTAALPCARSGACECVECLTQRAWGSYRSTCWSLGAGASGADDAGGETV